MLPVTPLQGLTVVCCLCVPDHRVHAVRARHILPAKGKGGGLGLGTGEVPSSRE